MGRQWRRMLWVVEMKSDEGESYGATVGCALTLAEGRDQLREWKKSNPRDTFRLVMYVPMIRMGRDR